MAADREAITAHFADLAGERRWVCWHYAERKGKRTKVPLQPNGRNARTDQPRTWTTLARCLAYAEATPGVGVGIVFNGDGLVGIDLDNCLDPTKGGIEPWAARIVADFNSYTEKTPSGLGLHVLCRGQLPGGATGTRRGNVEVYATGRFFTVTGGHWPDTPEEVVEAQEPLERLWAGLDAPDARPAANGAGEGASEAFQGDRGPDTPGRRLNTAALAKLGAWVPELFGDAAKFVKGKGGYRIAAPDLDRDLEEDLSIMPHGIRDWGMGDLGPDGADYGRQGKRTPLDLVLEFGGAPDELAAAAWLAEWLGKKLDDFGFQAKEGKRRGGRTGKADRASAEAESPAAEPGNAPAHEDGRAILRLSEEHVNANARACAQLLKEDLFLRGSLPAVLVRVEELAQVDDEAITVGGVQHARGSLILTEPTPERIQYRLDGKALFQRFDLKQEQWASKSCPTALARRVIGAAPELGFRPCAGIVAVPLFIHGEVVATNGYHDRTGTLVELQDGLPIIPEKPTKTEAEAALKTLLGPFLDYIDGRPEEDQRRLRAAFTAAALTAVLRPSLPSAPAILLDPNVAGAGKGKAARALAVIATGRHPSLITEGHSPEETEKRLAAAILSGAPVILLDNLQRELASSTLESGLTEGVATIRPFGRLVDTTVPCSALVLITANNAALRADMLRRTLSVRIVAETDQPELRRFGFDPCDRARRNRLQIIAAGLTIARAWWLAQDTDDGRRIRKTTLGSFETWAELVAGGVEWLVGINPVDLIEERKRQDPRGGDEHAVIEALAAWQGG
jgi:hypothetical protein